jgi:hypothetical protein
MKKSIFIYILLLGTIACGGPGPVGPSQNGKLVPFLVGNGLFCLAPFEPQNNWKMDIYVDVLTGPFSNTTTNFTGSNNNLTQYDIIVPTSGSMYTITVEIYPGLGTSCANCCQSFCTSKGRPEFRGMQTFSVGTSLHTVTINLVDCDCC